MFLFLTCLALGKTSNAQSYDDFFALFPTLTQTTTFTSEDMLTYPKNDKKTIPASYLGLMSGTGKLAYSSDKFANCKIYPLGKMVLSKTVTLFFLKLSSSYEEGYNTQMEIDVMTYQKDGTALQAACRDMIACGGDAKTNKFMYSGTVETDGKSWIKAIQTGTGDILKYNRTYGVSNKGLSLDKNE